MKFSSQTIRWMNKHYKSAGEIMPDGIDALVQKIGAQLGAVEEVVNQTSKYKGIVIAKVVSCQKHSNADKLNVCKIDDGNKTKGVQRDKDGFVQVVCGAPNVRAGMFVAWLPPGSTVPSSYDKEPFVLEAREIRGQVSNGMLASSRELDISDNHEGIAEVDIDAKPGDDFAKMFGLDGHIIDIENKMFTHRPDCFGWLGIARELAGIQKMQYKSPDWYIQEPKLPKKVDNLELQIKNNITDLVPRFMAIAMSSVTVTESPLWLQIELSKVGLKSINNIVDYTNLFMHETGQPLHAYDYDKLPTKSLETRLSIKGEKLTLLGGKELTFNDNETILITSGDKAIGMGGVMGGADTEVDEGTKNIVLECANFDMFAIRRASMAYGLFTDAATRFTKGQSPLQNQAVLAKIVNELSKYAGGKVATQLFDEKRKLSAPLAVHARADFINSRLGTNLTINEMAKLLKNVEFEVRINGPTIVVEPPFWRTDIEIAEDVVEEVGRLIGYDKLPLDLPKRNIIPAKRNEALDMQTWLREMLAKAGANEVLTYSFVHSNLIEKVGQDGKKAFKLSNALSPDVQYYRMSLTPSLLDKVHANIKQGFNEYAIFEIGKTHIKGELDPIEPEVPKEARTLSLVCATEDKLARSKYQGAAYYQARTYLDYLLEMTGAKDIFKLAPLKEQNLGKNTWLEQITAPFETTRAAVLTDSKKLVWGVVGEYKTAVKKALKLPKFCAGLELDPTLFLQVDTAKNTYTPLSKFPKVQQDLSLKVAKGMAYSEVYEVVVDAATEAEGLSVEIKPLDIYEKGETKHITFRFTVGSYDRTLNDKEVNKILDEVAKKAKKELSAERI